MSITANFPTIRPTLNLDFANSRTVDPRITFTRASTATYFDHLGVMRTAAANAARIDFDPVTLECKGLLIEEQRTNLLTWSQKFGGGGWDGGGGTATITDNSTVAPDGTTTAAAITSGVFKVISATAGVTYTFSVYIKNISGATLVMIGSDNQNAYVWFNAETGIIGSASDGVISSRVDNVGNGWFRVSVSFTAKSTYVASVIYAYSSPGSFFLWGAQLEEGAFPTSYIPTADSQVTRSADSAVMTGTNLSGWFTPAQGTFFAETGSGTAAGRIVGYNWPGAFVSMSIVPTVSSSWNGSVELLRPGAVNGFTKPVRHAIAYSTEGRAITREGLSPTTTTTTFGVVTIVGIGSSPSGSPTNNYLNGHIRRIAYYPARLTNAQLQALTA